MRNYNPFKPGSGKLDPSLFMTSRSEYAPTLENTPVSEDDKLKEYIFARSGEPVVEPKAAPEGEGMDSGVAALAGARAIASIGQEIGKAQQFASQQRQKIEGEQGQQSQQAIRRASGAKFRSLADLIQNYRGSIR